MDFRERKEAFYNRFGFEQPEILKEQGEIQFKNAILNHISSFDLELDEREIKLFSGTFGETTEFGAGGLSENIKKIFSQENDFLGFLFKFEYLIYFSSRLNKCREAINDIRFIFSNTGLSIDLLFSKGEYVIYPKGCAYLDDELVNVLCWTPTLILEPCVGVQKTLCVMR